MAPLSASTPTGSERSGRANGAVNVEAGSCPKRPARKGGENVVIATGKAACRNARPISAGLKGLAPSPPNTTLPRPIATTPPVATIQSGHGAGRVSPNSSPVINAEPSPIVGSRPVARHAAHSVPTHETTAVVSVAIAASPNAQHAKATVGASASTTLNMMMSTP